MGEKIIALTKKQNLFDIIILDKVEQKIRFLCSNISKVEWSGVLFYSVKGSFEDNNLQITCEDIFQMDEGSSTYTEFIMSPDVISYMVDNPELMDDNIYQGLIHSHNEMPTFFSSTDTNTLLSEGNDMAHFVSLIVNNAGNYTAAITRKVKKSIQGSENGSYPTWGGEEKSYTINYSKTEEELEYYNLRILKSSREFESDMLKRISEIRGSKALHKPVCNPTYVSPVKDLNKDSVHKQQEIPFVGADLEERVDIKSDDIPYGKIFTDPDVLDSVLKQIVTSSIIIPNGSRIDVVKWVSGMNSLYGKRFHDLNEFEGFATNFIDFIMNTTDPKIGLKDNDEIREQAILAYDLITALEKLPSNPWIDMYIKILDEYIV